MIWSAKWPCQKAQPGVRQVYYRVLQSLQNRLIACGPKVKQWGVGVWRNRAPGSCLGYAGGELSRKAASLGLTCAFSTEPDLVDRTDDRSTAARTL